MQNQFNDKSQKNKTAESDPQWLQIPESWEPQCEIVCWIHFNK